MTSKSIDNLYGNKIRVRACGVCVVDNTLLMANHRGLTDGDFWAPPGGGIEWNETAHQALRREFREETNLTIEVGDLLFTAEYYQPPLHAIELFFGVERQLGSLKTGSDPEMNSGEQIISEVRFLSWDEILGLNPKHLHGIFKYTPNPRGIIDLRGYFKL